ncbi:MAG TPA: hypothetical protein VNT01_06880 [Symbiobacteriaceae bacterium]|nr:hypothetical protein [Symbiobacteriaceae bacterium]
MASVEWKPEGLDSLVRYDAWRFSQGWEPIATELMDAVEAYFRPHDPKRPPRFLPGRPATRQGQPTDLRMVTVEIRSKPFRVFFRYRPGRQDFEILQLLHPHTQ